MGSIDEARGEEAQVQLEPEKESEAVAPVASRKADVRRRRPRSRFGSNDYVPPFRAARRAPPTDERERAMQVQRDAWLTMKKKINGVINRLNASNLRDCVAHLLRLNIIRGKGVFCKALMRAQLASADFSDVYAAFVSIVNTRVPEVGELLVCRLILQLKDGYARQEKLFCVSSLRFLAHLFNQQVINELPLLEFMSTCLIDPSGASIELAVLAMQECGHCLSEKSPRAAEMVFTRLREVLHDDAIEKRMQTLVDNILELRRKKFKTIWTLKRELDIVDDGDVIPHLFSLEDVTSSEAKEDLNSFSFDADFEENESKYSAIRAILVGDGSEIIDENAERDADERTAAEDAVNKGENGPVAEIKKPVAEQPEDMTASELVDFRRIVYLKIMSAASYEECAHKLTKLMRDNRGKEVELCNMVIECCSQEKTFLRYYGLLGQRLCLLDRMYVDAFEENFAKIYGTVHRYDTRKIRNIASFYASLLASNALPWAIMMVVHLVEEETTASSRIFLKILFQEAAKSMGSGQLIGKLGDEDTAKYLSTVFRRDEPKNTRFAINFFTSIGLGYLTDELRDSLTQMPKNSAKKSEAAKEDQEDDADSLSSSSLSSSSLSSSSGISGRDVPKPTNGEGDRGRGDRRDAERKDSELSPLRLSERPAPRSRSHSPNDEPRNSESRNEQRKKSRSRSRSRSMSSGDSSGYSRRRSRSPRNNVGSRGQIDSSPARRSPSSRSPRRYRGDTDGANEDGYSRGESPLRGSRREYAYRNGRSVSPPPRNPSRERRRGYGEDSGDSRDRSPVRRSPMRSPRRGYGDDSDRSRSPRRRSASRGSRRGYRSRSSSPPRRRSGSYDRRNRSRSSSSSDSRREYARRRRRSSSSSGETRKRKAIPRQDDLERRKERKTEAASRRRSGYYSDSSASADRGRGERRR